MPRKTIRNPKASYQSQNRTPVTANHYPRTFYSAQQPTPLWRRKSKLGPARLSYRTIPPPNVILPRGQSVAATASLAGPERRRLMLEALSLSPRVSLWKKKRIRKSHERERSQKMTGFESSQFARFTKPMESESVLKVPLHSQMTASASIRAIQDHSPPFPTTVSMCTRVVRAHVAHPPFERLRENIQRRGTMPVLLAPGNLTRNRRRRTVSK